MNSQDQDTAVEHDEARRLASERARSSYGTFVRVGEGEYNSNRNEYRFPLLLRRPRLVHESDGDGVIDVRFYSEQAFGEIVIDGKTRDIDAPHPETVFSKIRSREEEIERAIRKALVSTSGRKFAHLPFLENQFSPLEDIISQLLLKREISVQDIREVDENRDPPRYQEYVNELQDVELADSPTADTITAGDRLIKIHKDNGEQFDNALNEAMGVYFENNVDEFDMIYRTLGPYLVIAGRYYQRAIGREDLPAIHEQELRDAVASEYNGQRRVRMLFKFSRYLIQLQEVDILEPEYRNDTRMWIGDEDIQSGIEKAAVEFDPIQELIYTFS